MKEKFNYRVTERKSGEFEVGKYKMITSQAVNSKLISVFD